MITQMIRDSGSARVWAFSGDMGAGKTTIIKELCKQIGVTDLVSSPTFTIINEYRTAYDESVYHFDFYRIKSESEAYDLGYEQYLYSGKYCFIEWPEKIESLVPPGAVKVTIQVVGESRAITMSL